VRKKLGENPRVKIIIDESAYEAPRHFAFIYDAEADEGLIHVSAQAGRLPFFHLKAILLHEIGHIYDARYSLFKPENGYSRDPEIRADQIIERMTGLKIKYDTRMNLIQCLGEKDAIPRPYKLR